MRRLAAPLTLLALVAAGCGSGKKDSGIVHAPSKDASAVPATTTAAPATAAAGGATTVPASGPTKKKPKVAKLAGKAPSKLVVKDLVKGTGAVAKSGQTLTVDYVGVLAKNGKQFDASWGKQPFQFGLGQGMVIKGWDQGIAGMKVGGRRQLTIPARLGYGAQGAPPDIPANAALIFVIDLRSIDG